MISSEKKRRIGLSYGAFAAASYGTNPLFALPLYAVGIGVNSVLFYRYAIALVLYGLWLKFVKKINFKISLQEGFVLLILGLFFSLSSYTLFDAFKYIEAGIACTILFIYPVLVALMMTIFFKEKLTSIVVASIALTSCGIGLLYNCKTGVTLDLQGIMLVLASAFLYAFYIIGVKNNKTVKSINSAKLSFYVMVFGLIVYIINLKFCTKLQIPDKPYLWLFIIGLAIFPTIISLETITISIKLIGSTKTAVLGALEPLTAIFFGILFFHETLTPRIVLGIILILSGVILIITKNKPQIKNKRI